MSVPSTASSFQVHISSADRLDASLSGVFSRNDFRVNILGNINTFSQEYYVRLLAADVECNTAAGHMPHMCTIHASFGQQSIMSSNAQNRSNFLGVYADPKAVVAATGGHGVVEAQPYIRCSRPNLGDVNIQVRDAKTGLFATPSQGVINEVSLLVEFIPIDFSRVRTDIEGYAVPVL